MQFLRVGELGTEIPVVRNSDETYDLRPLTADIDGAFLEADGVARAIHAVESGELSRIDVEGLRVGAPISRPGKIVCIGLNYRDHAAETGAAIPAEPVIFMKDPSTVVGPYDDVLIPRRSAKTDWEVELAVVIGRTARYLENVEDAAACIAGYAISNDVSEREFQLERGGQWDKGKSCETFNPLGPWLVPAGQIADPQQLRLTLSVNGERRQDGSSADMVFGVYEVVRYLSQFMVLHPGDIVNTGTPAGVALGMPAPVYLADGDVIELSIDGLGTARQRCVQA